jgi:hypothetical protein
MPKNDAEAAFRGRFLLIPYQKVRFMSPLSGQEIINRVSTRVARQQSGWENAGKFQGEWSLQHKRFKIHYVPHGQNSALPFVTGAFAPQAQHTLVTLSFSMHPGVITFMILWAAFWMVFVVGAIQAREMSLGLLCFGPVGFAYLICVLPFNWEVIRAKEFVAEFFRVEPVEVKSNITS